MEAGGNNGKEKGKVKQGRSLLFSLLGLYFMAFKYIWGYILAC